MLAKYFLTVVLVLTVIFSMAQGSGNALDFDGSNDNVEINSSFPNMNGGSFTICAWFMTTNAGKAGQRIFCDDQQTSGPGGYAISLGDPGSGRLRFYCRGLSTVSLDVAGGSNYIVANNTWYHVAAVYNSTTRIRTIYLNGEVAATSAAHTAGDWAATDVDNGPATIGGESNGSSESGNRFQGQIDEVSFWTKALTQTEIRDLMCKSLGGTETNLIGYWNFNGATNVANGVPDSSPSGYTGTMRNMTAGDVITSAAPIGTSSTYTYTTAWGGVSLQLVSTKGDTLRVSNVSSATINNVHIYHVNTFPNTTSGITGLGGNDQYFGVFKSTYSGGSGTYTATYFYRENDAFVNSSALNDPDYAETNLRVFTRSNNSSTPWTMSATAPVTTTKTISLTAMSTEFILGHVNALANLPIELISFNAVLNDSKVDLSWTTASETNNDFFTIERSKDGLNWENILQVDGAGNSNAVINYFDADQQPLAGISYYRLKQTDFDGNFSYSNVEVVHNFNESSAQINAFPNPNDGNSFNLEFTGFGDEEVLVVVRDIQGKEYYSKMYLVNDNNTIYAVALTDKLPSGTYLVTASNNENMVSRKIVVR